ncbi:hypothetical protein [Lacihabitans sp. LS3-19]|uniref:hypothetical protein n=1 Tax=Lacihabitans sp. LS3-19 TaxID=2487335 RepID=UPI0020CC5CA4|nr:hypothetical protein [Lacihabitans sp. LS3-19]
MLPNTRNWKVDTKKYEKMSFESSTNENIMLDLAYNREEFSPSKTTVAGIPTKIAKYERITQTFNGLGNSFSITMDGFDEPLGNMVSVHLNNIGFSLKFSNFELFNVSNNNQSFTNPNYSGVNSSKIQSIVKFESDFKVNEKVFPQVLVFELKDGKIEDLEVDKIILAPLVGLVYFKTQSGVEYWRVNI